MNRERAKELLPLITHFANGGMVEVRNDASSVEEWITTNRVTPDLPDVYRIAVTKPSIDWSHVAAKWKWLTVDMDTRPQFHTLIPGPSGNIWCRPPSEGAIGDRITISGFASFKPGTCDWKDSLVERPS